MSRPTLDEVLQAPYRVLEKPVPASRRNTALLLVDVQQLATPDHLAHAAIEAGLDEAGTHEVLADYRARFNAAVAQCQALLHTARTADIARVHVKIEALSGDARDTGRAHRSLGWRYPPGSEETRFLDAVAPESGEIIITKTVSGAFTATNLDSVLRHMGIQWLIIAGFETDECIEATGRAALDLGYLALFAEDACTAYKAENHDFFMGKYASWGLVRSSAQLVEMIHALE